MQNITQSTTIASSTRVRKDGDETRQTTHLSWPLTVNLSLNIGADGSFTQTGSITEAYKRVDVQGDRRSVVSNSGQWGDTYPSRTGQAGTQRYFSLGPDGSCYSRTLTAAAGVLGTIVDGIGCRE